jgi:hypothetical protein
MRHKLFCYTTRAPWPLIRKQTIPTERQPLVDEVTTNFYGWRAVAVAANFGILDRSLYYLIEVDPQLSSRETVDTVPGPLLLRKFSSAGNRTQDPGTVTRNPNE